MFNNMLRYIGLYKILLCAAVSVLLLGSSCFCHAANYDSQSGITETSSSQSTQQLIDSQQIHTEPAAAPNDKPSFREKYGKTLSLCSIAVLITLVLLQLIIKWLESSVLARRLEKASADLSAALKLCKETEAAKSEYISYAAHVIQKTASSLENKLELNKDDNISITEYSDLIKSLRHLLDISYADEKSPGLKHEAFKLGDIISDIDRTYRSICEVKGIEFSEFKHEFEYNDLIGDTHKLMQILTSILNNSINFTPQGRSISLHTTQKYDGDGTVYIEFKVIDTGTGMSKEKVNSIFHSNNHLSDSFSGSGIGLSIVRVYTELMNGTVDAESIEGEGCTVTVTIPFEIVRDTSEKTYELKPVEYYDYSGYTALIAEDNELNIAILSELLKEIGFDIISVSDGRQAVYAFNKAKRDEIDVILLDIDMPVMNGYEAANTIRKSKHANYASVPIIGMSSEISAHDFKKQHKNVFTSCISKPIDIDELYYALDKYIVKHNKTADL